MRPLLGTASVRAKRFTLSDPYRTYEALVSRLLDAYGPYCAFCELPLRGGAFAWDSGTQSTAISASIVGFPLPICSMCDLAQASWQDPERQRPIYLPVSTPDATAPLPTVFIRMDGALHAEGWARSTIEFFSLNGGDFPDTRVRQRRDVIRLATRLEREAVDMPEINYQALADLVGATGFLTAWAQTWRVTHASSQHLLRVFDVFQSTPIRFPHTDWATLSEWVAAAH